MAKVQQQGQKPAQDDENVAVAEPEVSPFRHYEPGERPRTDPAYFELLLLKVLRVNGDIPDFDEVWPRAVQALAGMNLLRLSTYKPGDVREAIATVGGEFNVRMGGQAEAIIRWAQSLWRIRQIYGTFRRYIRSFESDGFEVLIEDLKVRLPGLSPEFLTGYLQEAGEKVPVPERPSGGRQPQQRQSPQSERHGGEQQRRQPQQQQPKQESGRGARRRRQGGRGGNRPPQQQPPVAQRPQQVPAASAAQASDVKPLADDAAKDPQQQQRRRNRRRFFRRRRSGGEDKPGGSPAPAAGN
jgi:hypothetical protein